MSRSRLIGTLLGLVVVLAVAAAAVWAVSRAASTLFPVASTPAPSAPLTLVEPTPEPSADDAEQLRARAEELLSGMTLHEKVCQLFVVYPEAITGVSKVTAAGEATRKALEQYPVGGFLYDRKNMVTKEQLTDLLTTVQTYSEIPLILTCDEEGGRVNRLMATVGTTWVGPMLDYKDQGTDVAFENARTIAADLVSCGFNTDLAPVADVWTNPENTVIGDRAYSTDFNTAAQLVAAAVEGFHDGGVGAVLKHFPGHGGTSAASHYGAAYLYRTLEELRQGELIPFQAGIAAGADAVMMGHLIVPDLDDQPAPLSHEIVTGLLREELGFDGVVMTDAMQMSALTKYYTDGQAAVLAIQAGVDILLCPGDLDGTIAALEGAVEDGSIPEARLDESVQRILTFKINRGLIPLE